MVPGEIVHHPLARGFAHSLDRFRMPIQFQDRRRQLAHVPRLNNDSFHAVVHHVARFPGRDLRQPAGGGFIHHLGAPFAL